MCRTLFFDKVVGLQPATLLKRNTERCFFLDENSTNTLFPKYLWATAYALWKN